MMAKTPQRKKRRIKAQVCALGQEIYPTASEHPTPAGDCLWIDSYDEAMKHLSEEEVKKISLDFREACETEEHCISHPHSDGESISVDQFTRYFSHCFGRVGSTMATPLFNHLTSYAGKSRRRKFSKEGSPRFLSFKPLVSAIYMWERGTMRDRLVLLFDMWDVDPKDGYLSMRELKNMVRACSRRRAASTVMMMEALHLDFTPLKIEESADDPVDLDGDYEDGGGGGGEEDEGASSGRKKQRRHPGKTRTNGQRKEKMRKRHEAGVMKAGRQAHALEKEAESHLSEEAHKPNDCDEEKAGLDGFSDPPHNNDPHHGKELGPGAFGAAKADVEEGEAKTKREATAKEDDGICFEAYEKEHARYESQACGCIDDELELFINEVFEDMDTKKDGLVSVDEWLRYAAGDRDIAEFLEHFTLQIL
eukprot:CAMPEP_0185257702 /NCGR_PEP_ID=MMETSP1359-20130426/6743_1 /TAXON_ID=552665 /ORGANISM="Bigelowiella longifila, Strain CCMP242" /LENGTH=420 /DNA_ID=CAMNT_0027842913 /DNA_START=17 /DNA_END=1279 /DNA_ORIENTATION=+